MSTRKKVVIAVFSTIAILLMLVTGFVLANNPSENGKYEDNYSPTGDRTYVRLVRTSNNKLDVYLEMADTTVIEETEEVKSGVSVASFQIGLDIELDLEDDEKSAVSFEFDKNLLLNSETYRELAKTTMTPKYEEHQGSKNKIGEILNIYYVGTKELNDANTKEGIKIGTITFSGIENEETVSITPDAEFTSISSVGHNESDVEVKPEDSLEDIIIEPTNDEPEEDNKNNTTDEPSVDKNNTTTEQPEQDKNNTTQEKDNTLGDTTGKDEPSTPKTGDIGIEAFVALMIISTLGIVVSMKIKNSRK